MKKIVLPTTGATINLVVFPFGDMLLSLLTDPVAMQASNLTLDPGDPFKKPHKQKNLGDFNTGLVHQKAYELYCTDPRKDILCEITLFIDKTHLDVKGKHTLEPIMFTLGIFRRSFRVLPAGMASNWLHP